MSDDVVIFKVQEGCELVVYVNGTVVARRKLRFPEVRMLIGDLLYHIGLQKDREESALPGRCAPGASRWPFSWFAH